MTEVAVIIESDTEITAQQYMQALENWTEYCRASLHEMWKCRPELETDPKLN